MAKGPLIILSGPAGSGKSTVVQRLLAGGGLPMHVSVSATTRAPRPGEIDGVHYHFWTRERFEAARRAGEFLESAEVHGQLYGTLRREVEGPREQGKAVILVIDVQGAEQVRRQCPDSILVFLRTSSWEEYERRLRQRGTEDEAAISRRLATARRELERKGEYTYEVINDDLDVAVARMRDLIARHFEKGQPCSTI
jgi:guanylate kinase